MADEAQNNEKPKIITDEDWKAEAQKEKEELAQEEAQQPEGGQAGERQIPPANFTTLVNTIATQAMMALGGYADPQSGKRFVDLELAKFHIDSLAVLQEKSKGNLDDEEAKLVEKAIYELRMGFVQMQKAAQQHMAEQAKQATEGGQAPAGGEGGQ